MKKPRKTTPRKPKSPAIRQDFAWPTFDSMAAASAGSGMPLALFRRLKRAGSHAFRSNRVEFGRFIVDLAALAMGGSAKDWRNTFEEFRAKTAKLEYGIMKDEYIPRSTVVNTARVTAATVVQVLKSKLLVELPARLDGQSAEVIGDSIEKCLDQAFEAISTGVPPPKRIPKTSTPTNKDHDQDPEN